MALMAKPVDGESFSSWVDRAANDLEVGRLEIWTRFGLVTPHSTHPTGYGVDLRNTDRNRIAELCGITPAQIDALMLRRYDGTCLNFDTFNLDDRTSAQTWARISWAYVWQSRACPECLAENPGKWLLSWKVPWSIACVQHRSYLLHHCPTCSKGFHVRPFDERQAYICCSDSPDATARRAASETKQRRLRDQICGTVISDIPRREAADSELLTLQAHLDSLLDPPDSARRDTARTTFELLKSCVTLALYMGDPQLLNNADQAVADRYVTHVAERDDPAPRRGAGAARYRTYSIAVPTDPLLMAAAVKLAAELAFGDPVQACEAFVDAGHHQYDVRHRWSQLDKFWKPPERIATALRQARDRRTFGITAALDGRSRRNVRHTNLTWRNVPQLFWEELTDSIGQQLVETGWREHTRRFLSISLARLLSPELSSFEQAAIALGLPAEVSAHAYRLSSRLRQTGEGGAFAERLHTVTQFLESVPEPIDYRTRRERLSVFAEIPVAAWETICRDSGVLKMDSVWQGRRKEAAGWVWVELTGGDFHYAPALGIEHLSGKPKNVAENRYRQYFIPKGLPDVRTQLEQFAQHILDREDLPGPIRQQGPAPSERSTEARGRASTCAPRRSPTYVDRSPYVL
jgi:hypothetical protein